MTSKTKLKLKKFINLQRQERTIEPMTEEQINTIKELYRDKYENIFTNTREEFTTPTYLKQYFLLEGLGLVSHLL